VFHYLKKQLAYHGTSTDIFLDVTPARMVRFFMVKLIHIGSNLKFDMSVIYIMINYFLMIDDVSVDSNVLFNLLHKSQDYVHLVFQI
jgi:hypothetical protein